MSPKASKTPALTDRVLHLRETRITAAGVMRCCLASVGEEYEGKPLRIGDKSQCKYCKEPFTLTQAKDYPLWKPDWQIAQDAAK